MPIITSVKKQKYKNDVIFQKHRFFVIVKRYDYKEIHTTVYSEPIEYEFRQKYYILLLRLKTYFEQYDNLDYSVRYSAQFTIYHNNDSLYFCLYLLQL